MGTYAIGTLVFGLQHTFRHPRPGVPVPSRVHGAVSREPSARFSAHIQSASSNFPHCSIGLSADGAVNTAHISVTCLMRSARCHGDVKVNEMANFIVFYDLSVHFTIKMVNIRSVEDISFYPLVSDSAPSANSF